MSKAEDLSQNRYPTMAERYAFIDGYEQAEKDLELTWETISIIRQIMFDYNSQVRNEMTIPSNEDYCKEILKRFKEQKDEDTD